MLLLLSNAGSSMYDLIEYSDIYSKTSENLWQYYRYCHKLPDVFE